MTEPEDDDAPVTNEDAQEQDDPDEPDAEESFTRDDELQEAFNPGPMQRVMGEDGMPVPVVDDVLADAHAPQFLPEKNQICHEMAEEFVVRGDHGEIWMRWPRDKVTRTPDGQYWADAGEGEPGAAIAEEVEESAEGYAAYVYRSVPEHDVDRSASRGRKFVVRVEPLRPACRHLVLQLTPPSKSLVHVLKYGELDRFCSARRSVAGAFLSLSNREIRACSMRDPFDCETAEVMVAFDRELAEKSRNRTYHKMFNVKEDREDEDKPLEAFQAMTDALIAEAKKETPTS